MIDEKILEELQAAFNIALHPKHPQDEKEADICTQILRSKFDEFFRLARLGLWAEKHGVPAVKLMECQMPSERFGEIAREALVALPGEEK